MGDRIDTVAGFTWKSDSPPLDSFHKQGVVQELDRILNSEAFRTSERSREFLSYVVQRSLEGHAESLKERLIGAELFHRPATYATGDDPVVRNKASEVRRRLAQYYHAETDPSNPRINLPVGSYVPEFQWNGQATRGKVEAPARAGRNRTLWYAAPVGLGICIILALVAAKLHYGAPSQDVVDKFWAPVFNTPLPVMICLAKPVLYRPSLDLYRRYSKTHPGTFETEVERNNNFLPLDPNEKLVWGDIRPNPDFGVGMGDVYAGTRLSALLGHMNKPVEVRIGNDYSYEDLRSAPSVVIGAFSNKWTLQMTSNLHFEFADRDGYLWVQERGSGGRSWTCQLKAGSPSGAQVTEDFGIVTRLIDSKTGQVLFAIAGITGAGCQAAGEIVSRQEYLAPALRTAPPDWPKKNMQIVFQTNVIDCVAGPPHIVATCFW